MKCDQCKRYYCGKCKVLESCLESYLDHKGEKHFRYTNNIKEIEKEYKRLVSYFKRISLSHDVEDNCILNKNENCIFFKADTRPKSVPHLMATQLMTTEYCIENTKEDLKSIINRVLDYTPAEKIIQIVLEESKRRSVTKKENVM